MTSMLKRVDNAVQAYIDDFVDGNVEGGKDVINDLSTDGVGLATSGGFIDDIQDDIDDYRQKIIDGEIKVPTDRRDLGAGPRRRARAHGRSTTAGPGALPGPAVPCRAAGLRSGRPCATRGCDIGAAGARSPPGRPAGDDGDPVAAVHTSSRAPRTRGRTGGRGPPWPQQERPARSAAAAGAEDRPVRRRAARDHQALPRRRRQPRHRAAGPPRRGARHRRRERRRQVDADEDPLRHAPPRRGHDPARRPRGALPQPGRRDRRRHRHGPPALHAGRQLHRPGEHRPGQRAHQRRPAGPRRGPPPDPRDLRPLRARPRPRRAGRGPRCRRPAAGRDRQGALPRRHAR